MSRTQMALSETSWEIAYVPGGENGPDWTLAMAARAPGNIVADMARAGVLPDPYWGENFRDCRCWSSATRIWGIAIKIAPRRFGRRPLRNSPRRRATWCFIWGTSSTVVVNSNIRFTLRRERPSASPSMKYRGTTTRPPCLRSTFATRSIPWSTTSGFVFYS